MRVDLLDRKLFVLSDFTIYEVGRGEVITYCTQLLNLLLSSLFMEMMLPIDFF